MSEWSKSYSQCGEDILLWRVLRNVENGFYIDIGAFDPNDDSVTRKFYDAGWSGINIEPNPDKLPKFEKDRPRDINLGIAINDRDAEIELHIVGETGLTTVLNDIAEKHQRSGWPIKKILVRARRLADVWNERIPVEQNVHFLKIDVEGAEEAVIRGADWTRHRPWILIIEAVEPNSTVESHRNWEPLLENEGYSFINFDGLNRYYVAKERAEIMEPLRAPINVATDKYMPAAELRVQDEMGKVRVELAAISQAYSEANKAYEALSLHVLQKEAQIAENASNIAALEEKLRETHAAAAAYKKSAEAALKDASNSYDALNQKFMIVNDELVATASRAAALEQQLQDVHTAAAEHAKSAESTYNDAVDAYDQLSGHVEFLRDKIARDAALVDDLEKQLAARRAC